MAAYAADSKNREFISIITVEQRSGAVAGIQSYDVTHSVSGRVKRTGSQADTKSQGVYPIKAAEISIADLIENVNATYQSVLSEDVLARLGADRSPDGYYSDRVKFSQETEKNGVDADPDSAYNLRCISEENSYTS